MEQRDYIEAMIEELGNSLRKMLALLSKNSSKNDELNTIASVENDFFTDFKITLDEFILLSNDDFKNKIIALQLKESHLEMLAQLFMQMLFLNKSYTNAKIEILKEKAIVCLDTADYLSNSLSITRNNNKKLILNSNNY